MGDYVYPGTAWAAPEQLAIGFDVPLVNWRHCPVCRGAWRPYTPGVPYAGEITYVVMRQMWVKIGHTRNLPERLGVLRRATEGCITKHPPDMTWALPLTLVVAFHGAIEHELHERWAHCHAAGEWVLPDQEMATWLLDQQAAWIAPTEQERAAASR